MSITVEMKINCGVCVKWEDKTVWSNELGNIDKKFLKGMKYTIYGN